MTIGLYRKLSDALDMTRGDIERYCNNAPKKYKVYTIPKRTSGERLIAHPAVKLKKIQRELVRILEGPEIGIPSHDNAFAYRKGASIVDNAKVHISSKYLLKMDFNDFFNSITPAIVEAELERHSVKLSKAELALLTNIVFWNKTKSYNGKLVLSVGAPSSPMLSNFVMFHFDDIMSAYCSSNNIKYTRYADDITFSTNVRGILFHIPKFVRDVLIGCFGHAVTVNNRKTVFSSKAHNRHVTGITLTNSNELSLGRERKRLISSMIFRYKQGINYVDKDSLSGYLAFALSVEPEFVDRMARKYSLETINKLIGKKYD